MNVPFFRPDLQSGEIDAVVETLRSGWLTTGPRTREFEERFSEAVGARHAVALNSGTAALHLAVEALGLREGQAVLVPTMTFAATAEVVRYLGGVPLLVDCDPVTGNMDFDDAARRAERWADGTHRPLPGASGKLAGVMPVHVGGLLLDPDAVRALARRFSLWIVEDAAHAFPAAWRPAAGGAWRRCGEATADVSCFSFYANKTITTGEGGMAVTDDDAAADRMRRMSLHGLSQDAWKRYSGNGGWDYRILDPGFKYNLTDLAAAIGLVQLSRAEPLRAARERVAAAYTQAFARLEEVETPPAPEDRRHSWHLYPIRLRLERLTADRDQIFEELGKEGVRCSVHWRPLHLHPYYAERFGWRPEELPAATALWRRLLSLPLFPSMRAEEVAHVTSAVERVCRRFAKT
jgi:perosamine synthetase